MSACLIISLFVLAVWQEKRLNDSSWLEASKAIGTITGISVVITCVIIFGMI